MTWHEGQCAVDNDQDVVIDLGDRDDSARAFALTALRRLRMTGGSGDDTIENLPQTGAEVSGGLGDDAILVHPNFGGKVDVHGDWGNDSITAVSASGVVNGDVGDDEITLTSFIDLPGETSSAHGGFGDDRISANGVTSMSLIDGGGGGDTIDCGFGFDHFAVHDGDTETSCELPFTPAAASAGVPGRGVSQRALRAPAGSDRAPTG